MAYFLRYTETPKQDLKRNASFHASGLSKKDSTMKNIANLFGCEEDSIVLLDNGMYNNSIANGDMCYFHQLEGLCGFELEAETLEEAIEEAKEFGFNEVYNSDSMRDIITIFEGEYLDDNLEGCLFDAKKIVYNK
jgi:hypothetical protein